MVLKMNTKNFFTNKKLIYWIIFILYAILNFIFLLNHEPWRDEVHSWLMAKELSIPELIVESRYDGHPILWHLILMPFAKLNFPIITLNLISYIVLLVTVWLFLFKTDVNFIIKVFATFTIPYTYIYSCISRNYCLILLLLVIIAILYPKRHKIPILYSIPICFLIHTHSLSWGIVAGLTITFYFLEIYLYFKKKNTANIKHILIGLGLIVINTILVVLQLFGTSNPDYMANSSSVVMDYTTISLILLAFCLIFTFFSGKKCLKEFVILLCGIGFQIFVYLTFYSSIMFQRQILIYVLFLFYIMILPKQNIKNFLQNSLVAFFIIFTLVCGYKEFSSYLTQDFSKPYSCAKEMASYINENIPDNTTILIDNSVIGQTIIPYLKPSISFYDIEHNKYVDCANTSHDYKKLAEVLSNSDMLSGNYIIICNNSFDLGQENLIYYTDSAIINENYYLYYFN